MKFYTQFQLWGATLYIRGWDGERRFEEKTFIEPTLFVPTHKDTEWKALNGTRVHPMTFSNPKEAREFIKENPQGMVFGFPKFEYEYINDNYGTLDGVPFDGSKIRIAVIDIENEIGEGGFPDPKSAPHPINAISIGYEGKIYSLGLKPVDVSHLPDVTYLNCGSEEKLLATFVNLVEEIDPDIFTGWNSSAYDWPYLVNRIDKILGNKVTQRLSPYGRVLQESLFIQGREETRVSIHGRTILDYLELYKKFAYTPQEKYSLDHIGEYELGENKIAYEGTLKDLYTNDYDKFIEYNAHDVRLVAKLERKRKLINLVYTYAYTTKVNYLDTFMTTRVWDVMIANTLRAEKIVVVSDFKHYKSETLMGGYVKDPIAGKYDWVMSFDVTSLYPSLIMQYNISPETMLDPALFQTLSPDDVVKETERYKAALEIAKQNNAVLCANGSMYRKDTEGFLPQLTKKLFDKRVEAKNKMIEKELLLEQVEKEIERRGLNIESAG